MFMDRNTPIMRLYLFLTCLFYFGSVLVTANELGDASTKLEDMIDEFFNWRLREYPEYAEDFGIYDRMDRVTNFTEADFTRQKTEAEAMLGKAQSLSMTGLSTQERVSLKLIVKQLQTFVEGYEYRKYSIYNMLSPMSKPTSYYRGLFSGRKETAEDFNALLTRLMLTETYIDQRITLMREAINLKYTSHNTSLTGAISAIEEEIVDNPADSYFYQVLFNRERPLMINQSTWNSLNQTGYSLTRDVVIPAWTRLRDFIRDEYYPNTRIGEGVGSLQGGKEYYEACLRWHTGVSLTAEEVHQIGLDEVDRISKLMEKEMAKDGFTGTLQEYIDDVVKGDPNNFFQDEQSMLDAYQKLIDDVRPKVPQLVNNGPQAECRVMKSSNPQGSMGSYSGPTDSRPYGVFWANVFEPETKTKSYMPALTLHEAEPGHHTQIAYAYEKLGHLPLFRQKLHSLGSTAVPFTWPTFTAHTEGWAMFAEALGEQIDAYTWKYSLFERYGSEIFRAVRLVVDTGLHVKGWSKEKAMEYKANYTTRSATTIENDINRYISWPGQACAYKIGQIKIELLRNTAAADLGSDFDVREFNEQIFKYGRIPLDILEEVIYDWILEKKEMRSDPTRYVQNLYDEYLEWRIKENPELGTGVGRHERDDRITEYTEEAFIRRRNEAEQILIKANAVYDISADRLIRKDRIELNIFRSMLQTFVDGFEYRKHSIYNMVSPLWDTPTSQWNRVFSGLQYKNVADYRDKAFKRMLLLETWVDQRIRLMSDAIRLNLTSHETSVLGHIEKIEGEEIVSNVTDSPVYKRFFNRDKPDDISLNEWMTLQEDCQMMIKDNYIPAWIRYRDFIRDVYTPNLRKTEGVWSMEDGQKYYEECLKWHLTLDMTADEVHNVGLAEVARISALMEQIKRDDNFEGSLKQYLEYLKVMPGNFYNSSETMLNGYREIVARVHPTLQKAFNNLPNVECRVEGDSDPQGVIGSYSGPYDGRPYGVFRVNIYEPEKKPKSDMTSLTLHEAEPGHHTHMAYVYEKLKDRADFRKYNFFDGRSAVPFTWQIFSSYTEGWALYAESLGELLGVYEGDIHSLFGRYTWEIFRAIRLVVDTGIHSKGWTKQEALDYIEQYTTFTNYTNVNEVNRYISWPGQACAYKIGQIKIEELRDRAKSDLGDSFDLREFHDQILQIGTVPLQVLEAVIDEWIDDQKRSQENRYLVDKLFSDFFEWRQSDHPEYSTYIGLHKYDDRISAWTEEAFLDSLEKSVQFLTRTENMNREGLDAQTNLHLDILEEHLKYFISGFPYRKYSTYNGLSPLSPPTEYWTGLMSSIKYDTIDDYHKAFDRLQHLGQYVDQRINLMQQSIENGITLHNTSLDQIPEKMQTEIVDNPEDSAYFKIFFERNIPVGITTSQWSSLQDSAREIISNVTVPAWDKFRTFLEEEYRPNVRPWEGVWSLPGGREFYQQCLRHFTSTNLSPEEIHQIGLEEVDKISKQMEEIMREDNFNGTLQEYIAQLRSDPNNFYTKEEDMLAGYEEIIKETHSKLDKVLHKIPEAYIDVKAATNPQASGGSYSSPPLDGSRNGTFTANVFNPETKPKFTMVSLTLHEAEPGHHTQLSYSIENDIPLWRRAREGFPSAEVPFTFPSYSGFIEGWALYAETLGLEMEAFDEQKWPHSVFGMYVSVMFRAVRLVVDTGIHAFGWSKQEAIDYALQYTTYSPIRVENEINRYISWPGQACSYKLGQNVLEKIRKRAEDKLGSQFDLKLFNDELLQIGAAPLTLVERHMDEWISSKKPTIPPTTPKPTQTTPSTSYAESVSKSYNAVWVMMFLIMVFFYTG